MVMFYIWIFGVICCFGPSYLLLDQIIEHGDEAPPTVLCAFGTSLGWFIVVPCYLSYYISKCIYEYYKN